MGQKTLSYFKYTTFHLNSSRTKTLNKGNILNFSLIAFLLLFILHPCVGQDCNKIPSSFSSYEQATNLVKSATFKIKESVVTSESSWIREATFYSCDSKKGFLIIKTDRGENIHQNLPIEIWKGFKSASSFGNYYNNYIKGNYQIILST
jgi:hypothetical protein